ncbi:dual specificity protein phosphatase 3 [Eurytemora carolleeae]|uniref:dual specificity protein phosphatase 3 n=1 Tax=Eurytemora carolleeae TaxID=1294199 RepID=UPI000C783807|nr:dual specificity protein phosphatase 3 [Eurytemora carolleeae]|eukprot:XP_023336889.1 dual specificity protein phosphatase 3-like [Eurytemora affinis]
MNYRNLSSTPTRGTTVSRGNSLPPSGLDGRDSRQRTSYRSERPSTPPNRNLRLKSPSIPKERTRDELIDSIVHTRTREHRVMPGFRSSTDYDERKSMRVDCDKVFNGIIIGNGETILNIDYLLGIGVTHVLNTAEQHVVVNPGKYSCHGIQYYGFHVDDLPQSNISRYFHRTTDFIHKAVSGGGVIVVNCFMGWSRSATCVAAYLMMKHNMTSTRALETIRQSRPIRPNAGFLQQLADLENTLAKRISWY